MALDNVTKEITADAQAKVARIKEAETAEIAAIRAEADAAIAELKEKEDKKLKEAIELLSRQESSSAELESKKIVLSKKKEILAEAFEVALADLESADKATKVARYKAMIRAAADVIDQPKVFVSKDDDVTAADLGVSSVAVDNRIKSGIVLQSADGSIEVDMQYETILRTIWDKEIKQLSDILFG